ncbi:hypothetical protein C8Q78DRAFT_980301 [Trametes maxima]|nr:hypothetical protein C8Q78DRAFT_980301 [Trametes maxima]
MKALRDRATQLENQAQQSRARIEGLQRQLACARDEHQLEAARSLLSIKSAELQEAQEFLTKADDVSDSEMLQLVENMNSHIVQLSASICDEFRAAYERGILGTEERARQAYQRLLTSQLLPQQLLDSLHNFDHSQDSVVAETALQAALTGYTAWLCNTWNLGVLPWLHDLYWSIRSNEPQSVAGRWRALSRKHTRVLLSTTEEQHNTGVRYMVLHVVDVLLVCGVTGSDHELPLKVVGRFGDAFRNVAELAFQFQSIASERIISHDVLIVYPNPGSPFDVSYMKDEWGGPTASQSRGERGTVLCAIQLGLMTEVALTADDKVKRGRGVRHTILLKSPVVLDTVLDELRREKNRPPSRRDADRCPRARQENSKPSDDFNTMRAESRRKE